MASNSEQLDIIIKAQDEASKTLAKVEDNVGGLGKSLATVGKAVGAATLAAGAAVTAFAVSSLKDFSDVGDAVEKMAGRTGLAAEAVSGLRVAADMGGTSIEAVEAAVKKMQIGMVAAEDGSIGLTESMKQFGITVFEDFPMMDVGEQFEFLAQKIGAIEDPAMRTQAAIAAFGKAGTDLIPMFEDGKFSMDQWIEQADKMGVKFDDLSAAKAAALNDALGALNTAWTGMKLRIAGELAPAITAFIEGALLPLGEKLIASLPSIEDVTAAFNNLKNGFMFAMDEVEKRTGLITDLKNAFTSVWNDIQTQVIPALNDLWTALQPLWPLLQFVAVVVGTVLVLALKAAVAVFSELFDYVTDVFATMSAFMKEVSEIYAPAISGLTAQMRELLKPITDLIGGFDKLKAAASAAMSAAKSAAGGAIAGAVLGPVAGLLPARADGGPVTGGKPYMVGEQGPELFVPRSSGTIVPNGGGAMEVRIMEGATVSVRSDADIRAIADQVAESLARTLQSQRNGLATAM